MTLSAHPTQCLRSYYFLPSTTSEKPQNPLISEIKYKVNSPPTHTHIKKHTQKKPNAIHLRHTAGIPQTPIHTDCIFFCVEPKRSLPLAVSYHQSVLHYVSTISKALG